MLLRGGSEAEVSSDSVKGERERELGCGNTQRRRRRRSECCCLDSVKDIGLRGEAEAELMAGTSAALQMRLLGCSSHAYHRLLRLVFLVVLAAHAAVAQEAGDQVDGQWENDGRVLFRRYGVESLQEVRRSICWGASCQGQVWRLYS